MMSFQNDEITSRNRKDLSKTQNTAEILFLFLFVIESNRGNQMVILACLFLLGFCCADSNVFYTAPLSHISHLNSDT